MRAALSGGSFCTESNNAARAVAGAKNRLLSF
jgi:hypothetical protein